MLEKHKIILIQERSTTIIAFKDPYEYIMNLRIDHGRNSIRMLSQILRFYC